MNIRKSAFMPALRFAAAAFAGEMAEDSNCPLGNHPTMTLTKSEPAKLRFAVSGTAEGQAMHMHELTLATPDKDHLTAGCTVFDKGAKGPTPSKAEFRSG